MKLISMDVQEEAEYIHKDFDLLVTLHDRMDCRVKMLNGHVLMLI